MARAHHLVIGVHTLDGTLPHRARCDLLTAIIISCTDHPDPIPIIRLAEQAMWCSRGVVSVEKWMNGHLNETLASSARCRVDDAALNLCGREW